MVQKLLQCERLLAYRNRYGQKTCVVDSMIDEFCAEAPDLEGFLFIEEGRSRPAIFITRARFRDAEGLRRVAVKAIHGQTGQRAVLKESFFKRLAQLRYQSFYLKIFSN